MSRIETHKFSIDEAFRECFYIVPDYQREYVWTDREVVQLLDDIDEQVGIDANREYFIGTILVAPTSEKNHFEVIDGQQRLTTFFLLLCALRHLFHAKPQEPILAGLISTSFTTSDGSVRTQLKLDPRYENAGEVLGKLLELEANPDTIGARLLASGVPVFGSLQNLANAYVTISRYLRANYESSSDISKYWGYLANNVVFIQISTDLSSALKIFETINERGVGLNPMDLLKNLLFKSVRPEQFSQLKDEWKKITRPLEKHAEKPLRFLRYFLMANYRIQNARGDAVVREDEIYDWFMNKDNAVLSGYAAKPFEFVRKIIRDVDQYLAFIDGRGNDGMASVPMDNMKRLCGGAFSLHFVLLLAASKFPKALFDHFVGQLESFLFCYIFTKTPTKDLERNFSLWADDLRAIAEITDATVQRQKINGFVNERFQKNMAAKDAELSDALKRYTLASMQQYRTRYLLSKLTQHVDMAYKGIKTPGSLHEYAVLEIEHILPDTPEPDLRAAFQAADPSADYDDYKTRLGNLTMLEKPINIVASNSFFELKKAEYRKCKYYLTSSLVELQTVGINSSINRINAKLKSFDTWSAKSIDDRGLVLIELAKVVWRTSSIEAPETSGIGIQ